MAGVSGANVVVNSGGSPDTIKAGWDRYNAHWHDYQSTSLTNQTGGGSVAGDVVAVDTANNLSYALDDTQGGFSQYGVVQATIAAAAAGEVALRGYATSVKATGAIARGAYVRKSATTKTVETTGVTVGAGVPVPPGTIGIATAAAAAGVVNLILFGYTVTWAVGAARVVGLLGKNNATTPNTQFELTSAVLVQLRDPTTGSIQVVSNPSTVTIDVAVAGPAANGRDQAGAFTASSWVHFYYIKGGGAIAGIASATAPATGPTLPSGYTHWAYAGAVYFNGVSNLVKTRIHGATMTYEAAVSVLSDGQATTETAIGLTAAIPANALRWKSWMNFYGASANTARLRLVTGTDWIVRTGYSGTYAQEFSGDVPNVGQNLYYLLDAAGGVTAGLYVLVTGYVVPNGDS